MADFASLLSESQVRFPPKSRRPAAPAECLNPDCQLSGDPGRARNGSYWGGKPPLRMSAKTQKVEHVERQNDHHNHEQIEGYGTITTNKPAIRFVQKEN